MSELQKALENWKAITEENAHFDSVGAFSEATVATSPIIDKLSTWAAAGTAAVAGISIGNIEKMSKFYIHDEVKWLLSCLAVSLVFALFQKYFAMMCSLSLSASSEVKERLKPILDTFEESAKNIEKMSEDNGLNVQAELDFQKTVSAYQELYPWYVKVFVRRSIAKSIENRNHHHKQMIVRFFWQGLTLLVQYTLLITFVVLAAYFI